MSWKATAYVKELRQAPNREAITCSEKLVMFVLADCYNEEYGRAWPSLDTLAQAALMTKRNVRRILRSLEGKGVLETTESRGVGHTNSYRFPGHSDECRKAKEDNLSGLSVGNTGRSGLQNRTREARKPDAALSAKPQRTEKQQLINDQQNERLYRRELEDMQRPGPVGEFARRHWMKLIGDPAESATLPDWFRRQAEAMLGK